MGLLFVIFVVFCIFGFIEALTKNSAPNQEQQQAEPVTDKTKFESLFPFIDVYTYYALEDGRSWTPEKVQLIKQILKDYLTTDWNRSLLKERLKLKQNRLLTVLMRDLKTSIDGNLKDTENIVLFICKLLTMDNLSEPVITQKVASLGRYLGLEEAAIQNILNQVLQPHRSHSQHEREQSSSQQQSSSEQQYNDNNEQYHSHSNLTIEWACSVLGLSPDDITPEKVQKAYRAKIKEYHPDKHQNLPESIQQLLHEKTQEVNEAKDIMRNWISEGKSLTKSDK